MKFIIPGRLDGLNEYTSSNRTNRYKANNDKKINQMHVKYAIRKARLNKVNEYSVRLRINWYEPNKKRDLDNIVLVGRLVCDPELRRTNSGEAVTIFTLAVNRPYESADGQQADYPNCVIWGKGAENVEKYCSKGSLVGVEGRLRTRHYDNAQGNRIYVTEVICQRVQFLDTKKKEETQQQKASQDNFYDTNFVLEDDDIDF